MTRSADGLSGMAAAGEPAAGAMTPVCLRPEFDWSVSGALRTGLRGLFVLSALTLLIAAVCTVMCVVFYLTEGLIA